MVDFNNENTIGTPAAEVVKIIILNRWWDLQEARESYYKNKYSGVNSNLSIVRARTRTLFDTLQASIKRRYKQEDFELLKDKSENGKKEKDMDEAYSILSKELDELHLTRIDLKPVYDRSKIETANRQAGY